METQRLTRGGRNDARCWSASGIRLAFGFGVLLSLGFSVSLAPARIASRGGAIALAQDKDDSYDEEFEKGLGLLRRHRFEEALKSFKRANDMRDKKSPECLLGMAQAYLGLEAYKNVIETCGKVIELAGSEPKFGAPAYNVKGLALQSQSEGKNQKKLQESEAAFRQGLALSADLPILHYNLGFVLMQQSRDPEGVAELQKYLELQPKAANAETARKMIENPRRAREAYAPEFSFTTSEGEYVTLEDLRGKVVVLDFWGTWCPPCVESVPSLRSLNKKYSKDPAFVLISVSSDSEEEKWRTFTAKNAMIWPQYLDSEREVQHSFGVRVFPTYIVIDHEGIVRFRDTGASSQTESSLEDAIRKQLKLVAKTAPGN